MSVKIEPDITVTLADGKKFILGPDDKIDRQTHVHITCDGPRCASYNSGASVTLHFTEEQVKKDVAALPDAFARFIKLGIDPFDFKELSFCGPRCAKDYLDYSYVPAKSPKERSEEMAATAKLENVLGGK